MVEKLLSPAPVVIQGEGNRREKVVNYDFFELDRGRKKPAPSEVQDMNKDEGSDLCIRFPLCAMDADDESPHHQLRDRSALRQPACTASK